MIEIDPVDGTRGAAALLYELLSERAPSSFISHQAMPTLEQHCAFVAAHPFRYWYLITANGELVGALECTLNNEIGVHILQRHRLKGYGSGALRLFLATHSPLPPIPAVRNGSWLANVAPNNAAGMDFFLRMGFLTIQLTMSKDDKSDG